MTNSQISVSNDFPQGMSNKQLQVAVNDYLSRVRESGSQENIVIQCYPLIALGLNELQARQNKIVTRISIFIGGVSLIVAGVALYISIAGAYSSDKTSARQVALLEELNKNILESQKAVETLIKLKAAPKQQVADPSFNRPPNGAR